MWVRNAWYVAAWSHAPTGFMKKLGERVDVWNSYDFVFPGVFLQRTVFFPLGTKEPTDAPLFYRLDEQAVTLMTARTSRYFYAAGARADDINDDRVDRLFDVTKAAFHEDKTIIEAQQKTIDLDPGRPMLPTSLDAGPTRFRKMVEAMVTGGDH